MVFEARGASGVKANVVPEKLTVPPMTVSPCLNMKVPGARIVEGSIASLNVAVMILLRSTPVELFVGSVDIAVGAVLSAAEPVMKLHTKSLAIALPARSLTPVAPP